MSFGFSIGDFIVVAQLASKVVSAARKACGAHDDLTREVTSLHIVLRQLQREVAKPSSILKSDHAERRAELAMLIEHCHKVLEVLDDILQRYNGLSSKKGRFTKFWKKVQFGNREMQDLSKTRLELSTHTNVITMYLNLSTVGSLGKVEEHMISHGEELKAVRRSVNWVTASMQASAAGGREGSILTSYTNDDKTFWKDFRRELIKEGYSSRVLSKHKTVIRDYVKELGDRGALDEVAAVDEVFFDDAEDTVENVSELSSISSDTDDESASVLETSSEMLPDHITNHSSLRTTSRGSQVAIEAESPPTKSGIEEESFGDENDLLLDSDSNGSDSSIDEDDAQEEHLRSPKDADIMGSPASTHLGINLDIRDDIHAAKEPSSWTPKDPGSSFAESQEGQSDIDEDATPSSARQEDASHGAESSEKLPSYHMTAATGPVCDPSVATLFELLRQQRITTTKASSDNASPGGDIHITPSCSENENVTTPIDESDIQTHASGNRDKTSAPTSVPLIPVFVGTLDGSWERIYKPDSGSATCELDVISSRIKKLLPLCLKFVDDLPMESITRQEYEYKTLTETLLQEGLLKLDAINADDIAIKTTRRSLVQRVQYIMEQLDAVHCRKEDCGPFRSFLNEAIGPEPKAPQRAMTVSKREAWKSFVSAIIMSAREKAHYGRDYESTRRLLSIVPEPLSYAATEVDARRYGIPLGYTLQFWDPACKPIILIDTVTSAERLGGLIFDWTSFTHWDNLMSGNVDLAAEVWFLLIDLGCSVRDSGDFVGSVETRKSRKILTKFKNSGERLLDKLQKILNECEEDYLLGPVAGFRNARMLKGISGGVADMPPVIDALFTTNYSSLMKWMENVGLWLLNFKANCDGILKHVTTSEEESDHGSNHLGQNNRRHPLTRENLESFLHEYTNDCDTDESGTDESTDNDTTFGTNGSMDSFRSNYKIAVR